MDISEIKQDFAIAKKELLDTLNLIDLYESRGVRAIKGQTRAINVLYKEKERLEDLLQILEANKTSWIKSQVMASRANEDMTVSDMVINHKIAEILNNDTVDQQDKENFCDALRSQWKTLKYLLRVPADQVPHLK